MADFLTAASLTLSNEGNYSNKTQDSGNYYKGLLIGSMFGISAPMLAQYLGRKPAVSDMKTLTRDVALKIYKKYYWDVMRGDEIINQDEANSIYDSFVNMGSEAIVLAQRALGIKETGHMDDFTVNKINNK